MSVLRLENSPEIETYGGGSNDFTRPLDPAHAPNDFLSRKEYARSD